MLQIIIISCNVFTAMANSAKPRRRNSTSEVVPWIPVARTGLFPSQGHDGPRPQLSFVLKVLAGDDCGVTQMHLGFRPVWRVQEQAGDARALFAVSQCEVLVRNSMIAMMRRLADLWIDSGKSGPNRECDNPSDRNTLYSPPESAAVDIDRWFTAEARIADIFYRLLGNEAQWPRIHLDGTQSLKEPMVGFTIDSSPIFDTSGEWERFGAKIAMYWFARLLDSPYSRHLARCEFCREYFAYDRAPRTKRKNPVYCPRCKGRAAVGRVQDSRRKESEAHLDAAAAVWGKWKYSRAYPNERAWIAQQVNTVCGTDFKQNWVSKKKVIEIQQRAEALRNAKS